MFRMLLLPVLYYIPFYQINGTTYHDQDGILEDLIQKEMEIRRTRGLNNIALPDGERLRPALRNYIEENF